MKVGLVFSLLNNDAAASLLFLIEKQILDRNVLTTAWFFEPIFKWLSLVTCRTTKVVFSTIDSVQHVEAVNF